MLRRFIFLFTLVSITSHAAVDESAPDENITRKKIDALIKERVDGKKRATLGFLQNTIALSISYGAPAYNQGDRQSCFRFYAKTAQALTAAFPDKSNATDSAWRSLQDLRSALERSGKSGDTDRNAWSMRYAFDKNALALAIATEHAQGLVQLGDDCFRRAQFEESEDAYLQTLAILDELEGQKREEVPFVCRYARMALGHAQFAQKRFKEASATLQAGLKDLPEWPTITLDLRSLHRDPAEYEDLLSELESQVKKSPEDPQLQFLVGYEYFYTGKRAAAREAMQKVQKLQPEHEAARVYSRKLDSLLKAPEKNVDEKPGMQAQDGAR